MKRLLVGIVAIGLLIGAVFAWRIIRASRLPQEINGQKVAAYVNNVPVFVTQVDNVAAAESGTTTLSAASRSAALSYLINSEILTQAGLKRNLATDTLVKQLIAEQKAFVSKDPNGKKVIAAAAAQLGVSSANYWSDPRVLDSYRRIAALEAMQKQIINDLPAAAQKNPAATEKAITDFIANEHAKVVTMKGSAVQ